MAFDDCLPTRLEGFENSHSFVEYTDHTYIASQVLKFISSKGSVRLTFQTLSNPKLALQSQVG